MLLDLQSKLIPSLSRLQLPFKVIGNNKDIADFVEVEIEDEANCLKKLAEEQQALHAIEICLHHPRRA